MYTLDEISAIERFLREMQPIIESKKFAQSEEAKIAIEAAFKLMAIIAQIKFIEEEEKYLESREKVRTC